ncbi:uncharacterized protein LOC133204318 [Saccostrea echinata]|uniref:uncharacterized protein LOC133204318 n=1 Tax=Saccostrea echinata TaxID=191078 RepID=UPI002A81477E|nr:uncharacterized protein LOC133204318 [Saccostrea echinata]
MQKLTDNKVNDELETIREANEKLQSSVTDLQARSVRDNLVFSGIPEHAWEDTERLLQDFIQRRFRLGYDISFERVHMVGKWSEFNEYPRNIVAKFSFFKDREFIRTNAARRFSGTKVWVNEQFPQEIEERRKKLYPVMRQARKDKKRTKLVRDILYIDGEVYTPPAGSTPLTSTAQQNPASQDTPRENNERQPLKRQRQGSTPDRPR